MRKKVDPRGRYARLYHDVCNTPAWAVLGPSAKALYVDLLMTYNGSNNGDLSASLGDLKHRGWRSSATLASAIYELMALGFLVRTRAGGVERGSRVCSLYGFSDLPIHANPKLGIEAAQPSHGYRLFTSRALAERALREGVDRLRAEAIERKEQASGKKSTLQKLKRTRSDFEAVEPFSSSVSEAVDPLIASETEARRAPMKSPQTRMQ